MIDILEEEITKDWGQWDVTKPLVSIRCITYNHENYISDALDGFLMQKTTFPFEIVVHDDASTDKTADIIRKYEEKYPNIVKPIYEIENQYSKPGYPLAKIVNSALKGKYVAFCEGDDYWIDTEKLQKQVTFLEQNPEYGMCYSKVINFFQSNNRFSQAWGGEAESFIDLLAANTVPTLTVVLKRNLYMEYRKEVDLYSQKWAVGDYPTWLWFAKHSKIHFDNTVTGVYRVLSESMSHSGDVNKRIKISRSLYDIRCYFAGEEYKHLVSEYNEDRELANYFFRVFDRKQTLLYIRKLKNKTTREKVIMLIVSSRVLFCLYKKVRGGI